MTLYMTGLPLAVFKMIVAYDKRHSQPIIFGDRIDEARQPLHSSVLFLDNCELTLDRKHANWLHSLSPAGRVPCLQNGNCLLKIVIKKGLTIHNHRKRRESKHQRKAKSANKPVTI